ncbi:hypothetical protein SSS_10755 [Sarcoptes scabiei]|nr:hypothetical protein SSS_10755 [Sarcoptes scabiei]
MLILSCFSLLMRPIVCYSKRNGKKILFSFITSIEIITLFNIASARSKNAWSILILALAEVSKNLIPCSRAIFSPRALLTTRFSVMSHLLPRIIFSTSSLAC